MKKFLGILVLGLLWCNTSFAADFKWTRVTTSDSSDWFYDKKTVFRVGSYKYFWQLVENKKRDEDGVKSTIMHAMVNCNNLKTRWITTTSYSESKGTGQIILDFIVPEEIQEYFYWMDYNPRNTNQGRLLEKVCKQ